MRPSRDELVRLVRAVDVANSSCFGLHRLVRLDLSGFLLTEVIPDATGQEYECTLMEYALRRLAGLTHRFRDSSRCSVGGQQAAGRRTERRIDSLCSIVASLFQSCACDISERSTQRCRMTGGKRVVSSPRASYLSFAFTSFALRLAAGGKVDEALIVWTLQRIHEMRRRADAESESAGGPAEPMRCGLCDACTSTNDDMLPLMCPDCDAVICEECMWLRLRERYMTTGIGCYRCAWWPDDMRRLLHDGIGTESHLLRGCGVDEIDCELMDGREHASGCADECARRRHENYVRSRHVYMTFRRGPDVAMDEDGNELNIAKSAQTSGDEGEQLAESAASSAANEEVEEDDDNEKSGRSKDGDHSKGRRRRFLMKPRSPYVAAAIFPGMTSRQGRTDALLRASAAGMIFKIVAIIANGADVNERDTYGSTALHLALYAKDLTSALILIGAGSDVGIIDNGGRDAIDIAATSFPELVPFLRSRRPAACEGDLRIGRGTRLPPSPTSKLSGGGSVWSLPDDIQGGAGAVFDDCFSEEFLESLERIMGALPAVECASGTYSSATRSYYFDLDNYVGGAISQLLQLTAASGSEGDGHARARTASAVEGVHRTGCGFSFPHLRLLHYRHAGGRLVPHVDLSKRDFVRREHSASVLPTSAVAEPTPKEPGRQRRTVEAVSTHTFLLYLTSCEEGGETVMLSKLVADLAYGKNVIQGRVEELERIGAGVIAAIKPKRGRLLIFPHSCPHAGAAVTRPKMLIRGECC